MHEAQNLSLLKVECLLEDPDPSFFFKANSTETIFNILSLSLSLYSPLYLSPSPTLCISSLDGLLCLPVLPPQTL